METWHRYGCAHLDLEVEHGTEASYLTVDIYADVHTEHCLVQRSSNTTCTTKINCMLL
jgi:hypothetical protein